MSVSNRHWRAGATALAVAALMAVATPSSFAASATPGSGGTTPSPGDLKVYVPIQEPKVEQKPVAAPKVPASSRANQVMTSSAHTFAQVSFAEIPGTVVPVWWLAIGLLAIPLTRLWRRWTAGMFE